MYRAGPLMGKLWPLPVATNKSQQAKGKPSPCWASNTPAPEALVPLPNLRQGLRSYLGWQRTNLRERGRYVPGGQCTRGWGSPLVFPAAGMGPGVGDIRTPGQVGHALSRSASSGSWRAQPRQRFLAAHCLVRRLHGRGRSCFHLGQPQAPRLEELVPAELHLRGSQGAPTAGQAGPGQPRSQTLPLPTVAPRPGLAPQEHGTKHRITETEGSREPSQVALALAPCQADTWVPDRVIKGRMKSLTFTALAWLI